MLYQSPKIVVLTRYLHLIMLPQSTFPQAAYAIHSWMYQLINGRTYQITLPIGKHDVFKFPQPAMLSTTTTKSINSKQFTYLLQCTENCVSCKESRKFNICYDSKCKYMLFYNAVLQFLAIKFLRYLAAQFHADRLRSLLM